LAQFIWKLGYNPGFQESLIGFLAFLDQITTQSDILAKISCTKIKISPDKANFGQPNSSAG